VDCGTIYCNYFGILFSALYILSYIHTIKPLAVNTLLTQLRIKKDLLIHCQITGLFLLLVFHASSWRGSSLVRYMTILHIIILLAVLIIFSSNQHGFVRGKSTCTNLLESLNDWTSYTGDGCHTSIILKDFGADGRLRYRLFPA